MPAKKRTTAVTAKKRTTAATTKKRIPTPRRASTPTTKKRTPRRAPVRGPNRRAIEKTLAALALVDDVDAARAQMLRSLADGVDKMPTRAMLWKEYREALREALEGVEDVDSGLADALDALKRASPMGNAPNA